MTLYSELLQISLDGWAASRAARYPAASASRAARAAARSNAPGASRAARSAASRSASSAAAVDAAEAARGASSIRWHDYPEEEEEERRRIRTGTAPPRAPRELVPGVDETDKDMESDEATWALYEQWCKAFNKVRDRSEMERRFHVFKRTAGSVLSCNEAREGMPGNYARLGLYADGFDAQDIAERKAVIEAAGCEHRLSLIDSLYPPDIIN